MKFKSLRKLGIFFVLAFALTTLSSCNRGMGCPSFSLNETALDGVKSLFQIFGF